MRDDRWIWITRWEDFQHYTPRRDRAPAWIKSYTAQLDDDRYLQLSVKDRSVLQDLRMLFARMRQRVPNDTRTISGLISQRVTNVTLERLNRAGLIEFCSREDLDHRLEKLYASRTRARAREEVEVEEERSSSTSNPRTRPPRSGDGDLTRLSADDALQQVIREGRPR